MTAVYSHPHDLDVLWITITCRRNGDRAFVAVSLSWVRDVHQDPTGSLAATASRSEPVTREHQPSQPAIGTAQRVLHWPTCGGL